MSATMKNVSLAAGTLNSTVVLGYKSPTRTFFIIRTKTDAFSSNLDAGGSKK